jgi:hypothetical protein
MATIDLTNFDSNTLGLVQSSQSRSGTPDGNIFFNTTTGEIELITASELATIDMTARGGGAAVANPLNDTDGVKMEALYAFEREQRRLDENLRKYDPYFEGSFKFAGAYNIINSRKFAGTDRVKVRGSGWRELASDGGIDRIYYGNVSLGNIESGSQPYYQLSQFGATVDYDKAGPIDEAIQVFGSTGNTPSDSGAGDFDTRTYEALSVRTYGYNHDRKVLADSGVSEMDGYSSGFALGESVHLTTNTTDHPLASVYNATPASQLAPWTNMTLEELDVARSEDGFNQGDAKSFTWVLNNPGNASLVQCVAYLDAIATVDADINTHSTNVTNGKQFNVWYRYTGAGKIQPIVGTASAADIGKAGEGLFIENLTGADKLNIALIDDAGTELTYPFYVTNTVTVGANAVADTNAWFHCFFRDGADNAVGGGDDFGTSGAVTVQTPDTTAVKGNINSLTQVVGELYRTANAVVFVFDYDGDTVGGPAGADKWVVFECEGDGGVTAAKTLWQITDISSTITTSCIPGVETNV